MLIGDLAGLHPVIKHREKNIGAKIVLGALIQHSGIERCREQAEKVADIGLLMYRRGFKKPQMISYFSEQFITIHETPPAESRIFPRKR
jgi:hypothetical protein